jgi:hypothetical protein
VYQLPAQDETGRSDEATGEEIQESAPDTELPPIEAYIEAQEEVQRDSDSGREVIQLQASQLHNYAPAAERLIAQDVYVRGQQLVRLGIAPELASVAKNLVKRSSQQRVIVPVNVEYLRRRLTSLAEFQRYSGREKKWNPTDCPRDLVQNILVAGDWEHFRPLEAIATAPFLRADLTVCDTPGYDPASCVFYAPNALFPSIPAKPGKDDAVAALERLSEPFKQFPYAGVSEAAFLSHVLAAVGRHAINTMPVFAYTAPLVASGKTLLAGMPSRIADGVEPGLHPYTDEAEEIRKVLMSALLAGDPGVLFDNVPNGTKVRSPVLCGFVTAAVYSDRRLGVSESVTLPNRCNVVLTGNNVTPAGDFARRCLVVRLDVDAESARGREFEIQNLQAHVLAHRPQLLVDALTIVLAYAQTGLPGPIPKPLESFETWSRIARDPLVWLGKGDAVETQQLETEDELAPLKEAFERIGGQPTLSSTFAARDIATLAGRFEGTELKAAIEGAGCSDATSPLKVGYWLREFRDRVASDRKLVQVGNSGGKAQWRLRGVDR